MVTLDWEVGSYIQLQQLVVDMSHHSEGDPLYDTKEQVKQLSHLCEPFSVGQNKLFSASLVFKLSLV